MVPAVTAPAAQAAAPEGQGFNLNASDLRFIFKQIQISQAHAATATAGNRCQTLVGDGPNQIPPTGQGRELPWGLRTVDGSCNNLVPLPQRETWGAADTVFPRHVPAAPRGQYASSGNVTDASPRKVSNLIVDQSTGNPAAVAAAGPGAVPDARGNLFIQNVATDVGLSAPFNSWFTLFGQFFDHGLDLVTKGGNGTVVMPLAADDPLVTGGLDGDPATPDQVPAGTPMFLTRTTDVADPGNQARNTTTSFVDQNQTYTSHPSHQVFLRQYALQTAAGATCTPASATCRTTETGRLLTGPGGGMADWDAVKLQARNLLGIQLSDADVLNIPLLMTDAYGHFTRATNGFPQVVFPAGSQPAGAVCEAPANGSVLCAGNPTTPLNVSAARKTGHAFLDDIAHHAVPVNQAGAALAADGDPGTTNDGLPGTYDDEMLGRHFVAGDGRTNENIGLTTVHHVFHSEHNRLRGVIDGMITNFAANGLTQAEANAWRALDTASGWGYGERLFQAARFVTEMEYQHLVFEEFARKVQPMVNPFGEGGTGYNTEVNASIHAEFAHAVYRFGHSMLTQTVARRSSTNENRDIPLLDAFLNPPAFTNPAPGVTLTPEQAAGDVVRGMTRQPGNEIDEFVTGALRNNLLGLPLDLASINMARARDTGIPTLNEARRSFFAESDNSALAPYESWADLRFSLKHPESLVNFIAAFGRHGTIRDSGPDDTPGNADDVTTLAAKRNAAALIVYGNAGPDGIMDDPATPAVESTDDIAGTQPTDSFAFLNSTGTWAMTPAGITTTGVDDIDLWVGGLAEKQMVFGGLLGPTFNYVFEGQMEDLQDGDRFYYLSRTAGLNLLTQLEGNSFAELVMRNTDAESLPADSFSFPAMVFNVDAIDNTPGTITDDPATPDWNESEELTRMPLPEPGGTIRYGGPEHVVFNGTAGNDRIWSSEGDDTIRGNDGDDWVQGGDGNDNHVGGLGDDILLDSNGDDTIKGGNGDDTISSGQGFGGDLNQGGLGNDFVVGGNDAAETFGGPGNDLVYAGDGDDTVFGDDGDDWIEAGRGAFNLLQGDNGAPFQDDPNAPGHDVLDGDGGEQDYDAEGGDDIMRAGPGIQRNEGMRGFDWVTHQGDPLPADSDMQFVGTEVIAVETNRDRFDLVEALSGFNFNDILRGDDRTAADLTAGANEPANAHVLNLAGLQRITNLNTLFRANQIPTQTRVFAGGNILIGGAGSDVIEGRGGDDIIDGDAQLAAQLRVPYRNGTVVTVDSLETVRADVLDGLIDPGAITIVRRIDRPANGNAVDVAVFSAPQTEYTITVNADGTRTVSHDGGAGIDGTDTLRGIEQLLFNQGTPGDTPDLPEAPTVTGATAGVNSATVTFTTGADGGLPIVDFRIRVFEGGSTTPSQVVTVPAPASSATITGLTAGVPVRFEVVARSAAGTSLASGSSSTVTPTAPATVPPSAPPTVPPTGPGSGPGTGPVTPPAGPVVPPTGKLQTPGAPSIGLAKSGVRGGKNTAVARWRAPSFDGGTDVTGYRVLALKIGKGGKVTRVIKSALVDPDARRLAMRLPDGNYRFRVMAVNAVGQGDRSARSNAVTSR